MLLCHKRITAFLINLYFLKVKLYINQVSKYFYANIIIYRNKNSKGKISD